MKHLMQTSCAALMAACLALPALAQDSTTTITPPPAGGASGSTLDANTGSESDTATGSESTTSATGTAGGAGSAPSDMSGTGAAASTEASGNATTDVGGSAGAAGSVAGGGALNNGDNNAGQNNASQGTGQGATPGSGQAANYGSVISGLQSGTSMQEQIAGIGEDTRIEVMLLSEMQDAGSAQRESLDQALEAGGETVAQMREQLSQNDRVMQALEAENHSTDDVIGIHDGGDGIIQLIVDDRSIL
ncbi:hypothetical protein [Paracoccus sp. (in: a-proteobacteria)]|uniref:hypothetical protein n=1 Tax=Paracoccus sp. TaxID=267 RepID=UPI00396D04AE